MSRMDKHYDAQRELLHALNGNAELVELVKGGFHNLVAKKTASFPRIVYSRLDNSDDAFADNELVKASVYFQVSIFTDSSTVSLQTELMKKISILMAKLNYRKYDESPDLYEEDTGLYHKALRFTKNYYK